MNRLLHTWPDRCVWVSAYVCLWVCVTLSGYVSMCVYVWVCVNVLCLCMWMCDNACVYLHACVHVIYHTSEDNLQCLPFYFVWDRILCHCVSQASYPESFLWVSSLCLPSPFPMGCAKIRDDCFYSFYKGFGDLNWGHRTCGVSILPSGPSA